MNRFVSCRFRGSVICFLIFAVCIGLGAAPLPVRITVKAVNGHATFSTNGVTFSPLLPGEYKAGAGLAINTDPTSTVDFILLDSGTALRIMPDTSLQFTSLSKLPLGEQVVSETSMKLVKGAVVGVQRKLAVPSHFEVSMLNGVATIVGTEYVINAGGAVTVLSGEVTINYNLPGSGGSVKVTIPQGYTFDPATGKVVATNPSYLQNIVDDVKTAEENAQTFKVNGATIVIKPTEVSTDKGDDNGGGDDKNGGDKDKGHH